MLLFRFFKTVKMSFLPFPDELHIILFIEVFGVPGRFLYYLEVCPAGKLLSVHCTTFYQFNRNKLSMVAQNLFSPLLRV